MIIQNMAILLKVYIYVVWNTLIFKGGKLPKKGVLSSHFPELETAERHSAILKPPQLDGNFAPSFGLFDHQPFQVPKMEESSPI